MYEIEAVDVMNQKFVLVGAWCECMWKEVWILVMKHILHPLLSKPGRLKLLIEISRPLWTESNVLYHEKMEILGVVLPIFFVKLKGT